MADVFISHSAKDGQPAALVCERLEAAGIKCWIAPRDVPAGANYATAIMNALGAARVLVLVVSRASSSSDQVLREVEQAVSKRLSILPVRIDETIPAGALAYFLSTSQWVEAYPDVAGQMHVVTNSVRALLDGQPPPRADLGTSLTLKGTLRAVVSWVFVALTAVLTIAVLQRWLAPMVPLRSILRLIRLQPLLLLIPVAYAGAAMLVDARARRRLAGAWQLQALFTPSSTAGSGRIVGAGTLAITLAIAGWAAPPAVRITVEEGPLGETPPPGFSADAYPNHNATYVTQDRTHYRVAVRPNRLIPPNSHRCTLQLTIRKPLGQGIVEFRHAYFDERLQFTEVFATPNYEGQTENLPAVRPLANFDREVYALVAISHDSTFKPAGNTLVASVRLDDGPAVESTPVSIDPVAWQRH